MIDILAIGAHPDDVELAASGTLLAQKNLGKSIAIVDLTRGELGTRGTPEIRETEAEKASQILGIQNRMNLNLKDGFFESDENALKALISVIRYFQPKIVLGNAIADRHPDHGRAAGLISRACFLSGLVKIETTWEDAAQQAHRPDVVYHFIQDRFIKPDFIVDITPFFDQKLEAIKAYKSQFYDENSQEPETAISSLNFIKYLEARAREMGRLIGVTYGEGFTAERPLGTKNIESFF